MLSSIQFEDYPQGGLRHGLGQGKVMLDLHISEAVVKLLGKELQASGEVEEESC